MRGLVALSATVALAVTTHAGHADFVVTNEPPQATTPEPGVNRALIIPGPGVVADEPHLDPGDRAPPPKPARPRPPLRIVEGFGDAIRLSFACRQIVPATIRLSYGPGADPGMIVSWKGGDTWPHVLTNAIKPLGLHMIVTGSNLKIEN
jgi:hypothetical protein